jgi:endonuclease/exonuclease/phosphatase (EEP) superfamily protein YafD
VTAVLAVAFIALAFPVLACRMAGGTWSSPRLAALAPLAAVVAVAGVAVAATASWWLALLLSAPAMPLLAWQLPPVGRTSRDASPARHRPPNPAPPSLTLRVLTLNVNKGSADPAVIVSELKLHQVDALAVQELTPEFALRLADAGITRLLPFCHLDPRPSSAGTGLWSRWPLIPLPPVTGLAAAAPRALVEPGDGWSLTLAAVHVIAPVRRRTLAWERELGLIASALASGDGLQVVAGDFNASRDHRPFRDLLAAGLVDCADAARRRTWPGFTWPAQRGLPIMRLDHVLVTRPGVTVRAAEMIRVPGTDHRGVLAEISLAPAASDESGSADHRTQL